MLAIAPRRPRRRTSTPTARPARPASAASPARGLIATRGVWVAGVGALNLAPVLVLDVSPAGMATLALLNLVLAAAARNEPVVAWCFRWSSRRGGFRLHVLAHRLGQLHRSAAVVAVAWFLAFVLLSWASLSLRDKVLAAAVLLSLLTICAAASTRVRTAHHELFELTHRWLGRAGAAATLALVVDAAAPGPVRAAQLLLAGALIVLLTAPWLGVRRVRPRIVAVTEHALMLAFPGELVAGTFLRISLDGREWHAFAATDTGDLRPGELAVIISRAGDWTARLIDGALAGRVPTTIRVRRRATPGFMSHLPSTRRPLVVATGSGIAPVLPHLLDPRTDLSCLWVAPDHDTVFGAAFVRRVLATGRVRLHDTGTGGRPTPASLVELARRRDHDALFVVTNPQLTGQLIDLCERSQLPCYAPTFDS